jgi:predicted AlkP superfamily pyrophosphatase or phosphodiesterase
MNKLLWSILLFSVLNACQSDKPKENSKPYLLIVSIDGYRWDYTDMYNPPTIKKFREEGSSSAGLIPCYPSKTFPNHYTIISGMRPGKHGLIDNHFYDSRRKQSYINRDDSVVEDGSWYGGVPLWNLAEKNGLRSASYFWIASASNINGMKQSMSSRYTQTISEKKRTEEVIKWLQLPENERPHLITLYYESVDEVGHRMGPVSDTLKRAILKIDSLIGTVLEAAQKENIPLNVILVSDHGMGQVDLCGQSIHLEDLGDLADFKMANSGTHLHLYHSDAKKVQKKYEELKKLKLPMRVYKRDSVPTQLHYSHYRVGDLFLMAESPNNFIGTDCEANDSKGAHGFDPVNRDMHGFFYAKGPQIRSGVRLEAFENIHIYPFAAKVLGLTAPDSIDGNLNVLQKLLLDQK